MNRIIHTGELYRYTDNIYKVVTARFVSFNHTINNTFTEDDPYDYFKAINQDPRYCENIMKDVAVLTDLPLLPTDERNKLLPINNYEDIYNCSVLIKDIKFNAYYVRSKGGAGISAELVNEIILNSLNSVNNAYPQSQFKLSPIPSFQPNFFTPIIRINGNNLFEVEKTNKKYGDANINLFAYGKELPYYVEIFQRYDNIKDIEVYGQCYNVIDINGNTYFQRYPLMCEITIYLLKDIN